MPAAGLGLLEGLGIVVIAVDLGDELDVLVLGVGRQVLLHELDPLVLVGGVCRCRKNGNLALAADLLGDQLGLDQCDVLGDNLGDEYVAAIRVGVRVEGDDLGTGGTGSARAEQTASGSFAAITMALVPACVSALMKVTWEEADASSGPTTLVVAKPAALAPSLPPPSTTSV